MSEASQPREDDLSIHDDAELWRRIPPFHLIEVEGGGLRISSAAFQDHKDGSPMSVVLGGEVLAAGRDARTVIAGHDNYCLASVTAGLARSLDQGVIRKPLDEELAHAEVFGRKTKSVRSKFTKAAIWIIGPENGAP